jgi:hypothetical protein
MAVDMAVLEAQLSIMGNEVAQIDAELVSKRAQLADTQAQLEVAVASVAFFQLVSNQQVNKLSVTLYLTRV